MFGRRKVKTLLKDFKDAIVSAPVLAYPARKGKLGRVILSLTLMLARLPLVQSCAVLSQNQDGEQKVIAFASRALSRYKQNITVRRTE